MTFIFYQYTDDKKRVDKTNYLGTALATKTNCTFKKPEDKGQPQIVVAYDSAIMSANYLYITELSSYYYLSEPILANQRLVFNATKDLLFTEKENIKNLKCIISRQEHEYNAYLNDDRYPVLNKQQVNTLPFPRGFAPKGDESIVLVVNGS